MAQRLAKTFVVNVGLDEGETRLEILWCGLSVLVLEGLERFILGTLEMLR